MPIKIFPNGQLFDIILLRNKQLMWFCFAKFAISMIRIGISFYLLYNRINHSAGIMSNAMMQKFQSIENMP